jgi:8-oxo-dGTP pyrophosphatase MutT (NUDIX family)
MTSYNNDKSSYSPRPPSKYFNNSGNNKTDQKSKSHFYSSKNHYQNNNQNKTKTQYQYREEYDPNTQSKTQISHNKQELLDNFKASNTYKKPIINYSSRQAITRNELELQLKQKNSQPKLGLTYQRSYNKNYDKNVPTVDYSQDYNNDIVPVDFVNAKSVNYKNRNGYMAYKQFALRHVFRAGAIVWIKSRGKDYYIVFKSLTRPTRGIQLPGGRVEKRENIADTILREVYEETGVQCRIICPLGYIYFENPKDNYSNMQMYYIIKPLYPIDVTKRWRHIDKDTSRQTLEVWCVDAGVSPEFLSVGQDSVVTMFNQWLSDHKKIYNDLNEIGEIGKEDKDIEDDQD